MEPLVDDSLPSLANEAARRQADEHNSRMRRRVAVGLTVFGASAALLLLVLGRYTLLPLALAGLLVAVVAALRGDDPRLGRHRRLVLIAFLLIEFVLLLVPVWGLETPWRVVLAGLGLPLLVIAFYLRPLEYLLLLAPLWAATVALWWTGLDGRWLAPGGLGPVIWPTAVSAALFAVASARWRRWHRGFIARWRREEARERESDRLRGEIEDARQIQLSMLPRGTPQLDWLDVASVSMPASEVGGDYYDFHVGADGSLALVVADVAGHGLASGLLLSGLRSCLFLLRDELASPAGVLAKLDRMVRHSSERRMLVTLLACHLDRDRRELILACAGHPPVVRYSPASGEVLELGIPAVPLGTRLPVRYEQLSTPLAGGDILLFYTDGLTEIANSAGEPYGVERLRRVLRSNAAGGARDVRNAVLADVSYFKGDSRRLDDLTLVVVRVR